MTDLYEYLKVHGYDPLLSREEIEYLGVNALDDLKNMMNDKSILIDIRGIFDKEEAEEMGIGYKRFQLFWRI